MYTIGGGIQVDGDLRARPLTNTTFLAVGALLGSFIGTTGNGPNFMVKAIAEERGIKMPSFFHHMFYSVGILIPLFLLVTFVFFVLYLV